MLYRRNIQIIRFIFIDQGHSLLMDCEYPANPIKEIRNIRIILFIFNSFKLVNRSTHLEHGQIHCNKNNSHQRSNKYN